MRQLAPYSLQALLPLAKDALVARQELKLLLPTLEALGVVQVERQGSTVATVRALVLSQADVMDQVARL